VRVACYKEKSTIRKPQILGAIKNTLLLLRKEYILADNEAEFAPIISFILRIKGVNEPLFWEGCCGKEMNAEDIAKFLVGEYYNFMDAPAAYSMGMLKTETSENELEDAINWVDATKFQGSEKQVKWAKDIAHKNLEYICKLWKSGQEPSISAKWWIENRNEI